MSNSGSMSFCTYCGEKFTRAEHLERHILKHTNVKPYMCGICHMSFSRRDLMRRHQGIVHGKDPKLNELLGLSKTPGRIPRACRNCAKTKTKCDERVPCNRCEVRGLPCSRRAMDRTRSAPEFAELHKVSYQSYAGPGGATPPIDEDQHEGVEIELARTASPTGSTPSRAHSLASESPVTPPSTNEFFSMPTEAWNTGVEQDFQFASVPLEWNFNAEPKLDPTTASFDVSFDGWQGPAQTMQGAQLPQGADYPTTLPLHFETPPSMDRLNLAQPEDHPMQNLEVHCISVPEPAQVNLMNFQSPSTALPISPSTVPASANPFHPEDQFNRDVRAESGWSFCRSSSPVVLQGARSTTMLKLQKLQNVLRHPEEWGTWNSSPLVQRSPEDRVLLVPVQESTRDSLLGLFQVFFGRAMRFHDHDGVSSADRSRQTIVLPGPQRLSELLQAHLNSFEPLYPLLCDTQLDLNRFLQQQADNEVASLFAIMMLARGAVCVPNEEAKWIGIGAAEVCGVSILGIVRRQIHFATEQWTGITAFLFIELCLWSGDKWLMDIATSQFASYATLLRNAGELIPKPGQPSGAEVEWMEWRHQEFQHRLTYAWMLLDHERALFHGVSPFLDASELEIPLPHHNDLWHASTAEQWHLAQKQHALHSTSLRELYRSLMTDNIDSDGRILTAFELKLLLHPIQSLIYRCTELAAYLRDAVFTRRSYRTVSLATIGAQHELITTLLQRWRELAERHRKSMKIEEEAMMRAATVMHSLMCLETTVHFSEVETFSMKQTELTTSTFVSTHLSEDEKRAVLLCEEVFDLIRSMGSKGRPRWLPTVIHRIGLVLVSLEARQESSGSNPGASYNVMGDRCEVPNLIAAARPSSEESFFREGCGLQAVLVDRQLLIERCIAMVRTHCFGMLADGFALKLAALLNPT